MRVSVSTSSAVLVGRTLPSAVVPREQGTGSGTLRGLLAQVLLKVPREWSPCTKERGTWVHRNTTVSFTPLLLLAIDAQPATSRCDTVRLQRNEGRGDNQQG